MTDHVGVDHEGTLHGTSRIDKAEEWTWMYLVVARKRDAPEVTP